MRQPRRQTALRWGLVGAVVVTMGALLVAVLVGALRPASDPPASDPPVSEVPSGLEQMSGLDTNPGALGMFAYQPAGLRPGAPLVVELHGCGQSAAAYFAASGWRTFADRHDFALVLPQQSAANNPSGCFNWFLAEDTTRGQGEAASIAAMIDHAVAAFGSDPSRVYVTGLSAGAAMTAVMLATYPDKVAGGSISAGVPYRCATTPIEAVRCGLGVDRTPEEWGDLVRAASPWTGARPRVVIWHGDRDRIVAPGNAAELRDQFTDVLGVSQSPTSLGTLTPEVTWEDYAGQVRLYRVATMGHSTPIAPGPGVDQCGDVRGAFIPAPVCAAYHDVRSFGLDGER